MASESKRGYASSFEADSHDHHLQSKIRALEKTDSVRIGLTLVALLMGISILGVSADTLAVYDNTHVSREYLLPLWPAEFNLRPTVALVVGSSIVILANTASLLSSKVQSVSRNPPIRRVFSHDHTAFTNSRYHVQLRSKVTVHTSVAFAAPFVGLAAAVISMIFFYAVNASTTEDTLLSWTCRWKAVPMLQRPHFGTLCKESYAGLYMAILLIPLEALVLAVAGWQMKLERYTTAYANARKNTPTGH